MKIDKWDSIGEELTEILGICSCQSKLKSIVVDLAKIRKKCIDAIEIGTPRDFTGAEWLLIALMDENDLGFLHGINCRYPLINEGHELWTFIDSIINDEALIDK